MEEASSLAGPHREAPGLVSRQREWRDGGPEPLLWFCRKVWARQGKPAEYWQVRIISVGSGARRLLLIVWHLPRGEECRGLVARSVGAPIGGVACGLWVGLHLKGVITAKSFTLSRDGLSLGGAVTPGSASPQDVKASEYRK